MPFSGETFRQFQPLESPLTRPDVSQAKKLIRHAFDSPKWGDVRQIAFTDLTARWRADDSRDQKQLQLAEKDRRQHQGQFKGYEAAEGYMQTLFHAYREAFYTDFVTNPVHRDHSGPAISIAFSESLNTIA